MAQTAIIQAEGYKFQGGYLQTVGSSGGATSTSSANANYINTVVPFSSHRMDSTPTAAHTS
jgi:hypothetical protein